MKIVKLILKKKKSKNEKKGSQSALYILTLPLDRKQFFLMLAPVLTDKEEGPRHDVFCACNALLLYWPLYVCHSTFTVERDLNVDI